MLGCDSSGQVWHRQYDASGWVCVYVAKPYCTDLPPLPSNSQPVLSDSELAVGLNVAPGDGGLYVAVGLAGRNIYVVLKLHSQKLVRAVLWG